jgi:hypothetical protein
MGHEDGYTMSPFTSLGDPARFQIAAGRLSLIAAQDPNANNRSYNRDQYQQQRRHNQVEFGGSHCRLSRPMYPIASRTGGNHQKAKRGQQQIQLDPIHGFSLPSMT